MKLTPTIVYIPQPDSEDKRITSSFQINCLMVKEEKYVLSKEDVIKLLKDAFGAGSLYRSADITGNDSHPNEEQFINNILNQ